MPDIQIVVSREGVAMASKSHAGKTWMIENIEHGVLYTGNDVIVYIEEKHVNSMIKEIHDAGLEALVLC